MEFNNNFEKQNIQKDLFELEKRQTYRRKIDLVFKIYSYIGLMIAIIGIVYFILITFSFEFTKSQQIALVFAGIGLALSVTSRIFLLMRKERMEYETKKIKLMQYLSEFIWKWSKFESVSKETLLKKGKEYNKYSIRATIDHLYHENIIDDSDIVILEEAIQARNSAVHGGDSFPIDMIIQYTKQIDGIIAKIQKAKMY